MTEDYCSETGELLYLMLSQSKKGESILPFFESNVF